MGYYYHATPVNGGLHVPAENQAALLRALQEALDDEPTLGGISFTDIPGVVEVLRDNGFFIHEIEDGALVLTGWGAEGDPASGYPTVGAKIHDTHPESIITVFHEHSTPHTGGSDAGVMVFDDYEGDYLFLTSHGHRIPQSGAVEDTVRLIQVREFTDPAHNVAVQTAEYLPVRELALTQYPAHIIATDVFTTIHHFVNAYEHPDAEYGSGAPEPADYSNSLSSGEMKGALASATRLVERLSRSQDRNQKREC